MIVFQPEKEFHVDFYGIREDGTLIYIESLQRKTDQDGLAIFREHLHLPDGATSIRATATLAAAAPAPGSTTMLSNGLARSGRRGQGVRSPAGNEPEGDIAIALRCL